MSAGWSGRGGSQSMPSRRPRLSGAATRSSRGTPAPRCSPPRAWTRTRGSPCSTPGTNLPAMARSWADLLGDEGTPADETERSGFFTRLRDSLGKSRRALTEELALASFDPADDASWERLEEALIAADVGVPATAELVQRLEARGDGDLTGGLEEELARMLGESGRLELDGRPSVVLVV